MSLKRIGSFVLFPALCLVAMSSSLCLAAEYQSFDRSKLDQVSSGCFSCHDDPGEYPIKCCFLPFKGKGKNHLISTSYSELVERNKGLRSEESLPQEMVLYEGKVTCVTCHGDDSHNGITTVLDKNGTLCYACHLD